MIYIFTALYCEAHIYIEHFGLKKLTDHTRFQQFYNESAGILLTVCGVGEIAAAAAVSSVCTEYRPDQNDFLLNTGICAADEGKEGIFLVHKIVEQGTGRTFYPDILYRHGFSEASLVTGMAPWSRTDGPGPVWKAGSDDAALYDMEAAAVYQAGAYFFGPHQMIFLKIVSDHGEGSGISKERTERLIRQYGERIFVFLNRLFAVGSGKRQQSYTDDAGKILKQRFEQVFEQLCADMHCSKAMGDSLRQHMHYAVLTGIDYEAAAGEMYEHRLLPCKDKRDGKRCFAELKRRLF